MAPECGTAAESMVDARRRCHHDQVTRRGRSTPATLSPPCRKQGTRRRAKGMLAFAWTELYT